MKEIRNLAKQTVIYGFGTVIPRFLNYALMTPFYTRIFEKNQYGVVTELYAWIAFLMVVLTYGMETTYFRFSGKKASEEKVYSNAVISLFFTSVLFILLINIFIKDVSGFLKYENHPEYIRLFAWIVAIDAFSAIPFAYLRNKKRPIVFSALKIINVTVIIVIVMFFLKIAPAVLDKGGDWILKYYNPDFSVGYVFVANLCGSAITLIMLIPFIVKIKLKFDWKLYRNMLVYTWPLLIGGMAGIINEVLDKILLRRIIGGDEGLETVGLYGAGFKVGVLMSLFIQTYRFAAEPFFFEKAGRKDDKEIYALTMKYFVIAGLLIFLFLNLFIEQIQFIVGPVYRESLVVVPVISMGFLLLGIFINQSIWYKVDDKTIYGAWITIAGAAVTVTINVLLVPVFGYIASAWAHVACYLTMIIISYVIGQKLYPIDYDKKSIIGYTAIAITVIFISGAMKELPGVIRIIANILFILLFCIMIEKREKIFSNIIKR